MTGPTISSLSSVRRKPSLIVSASPRVSSFTLLLRARGNPQQLRILWGSTANNIIATNDQTIINLTLFIEHTYTLNTIKMVRPVLYSAEVSPPCRSVLMAIAVAGIDVDIQEIDLLAQDHLKEEFVKMNPQHTVPTLNDNGFILTDSHAIVTYLIDKYAKDDSLYPKDLQKRALVNQFLHLNNALLFANMKGICYPIFFKGAGEIPQERVELLTTACGFLEKYLQDTNWLVGDTCTLADISVISTAAGFPVCLSLEKFPKLTAWMKRCEDQIPGYATINAPGNIMFMNAMRERIRNN